MKLFRRLLRSLFPDELQTKGMNPVGMFVWLISPKQFFSVIHRRLVENFKLNMFDVALDPFEAKIGLGDQSSLKVKDIDLYYAYGAVANLNGWSFYGPGNLGMLVTMVVSVQLREQLSQVPHQYVSGLFLSTYLLTYLFAARVKVFPEISQEEKYQWFVDTYFNFYTLVLRKQWVTLSERSLNAVRKAALQNIQLYFMLFYYYQRIGSLFINKGISGRDFYQWLFYDELKTTTSVSQSVQRFVHQYRERTVSEVFDQVDEDVITLVLPADIQMRYLYKGKDWFLITDLLLAKVFSDIDLNAELLPFLKGDSTLESFLEKLFDHTRFKHQYFNWSKQVTRHKFTLNQSYEVSKEIDTFMSTIEESGSIDGVKVPEQLKQESLLMDRLINFYVTFMGGLRIGRGDTFFVRLFRRNLISELIEEMGHHVMQQDSLYYYGGLLYSYSKNVFHYKYAYDNVRAGKNSFQVPVESSFKEVYSNMFILKLFDESFVTTLLQDIQKKNRTLSVSNETIIQTFRRFLGDQISHAVSLGKDELFNYIYSPAFSLMQSGDACQKIIAGNSKEKDMSFLKENLYTLDIWLRWECCGLIAQGKSLLGVYGDLSIAGVVSMVRETLFGFLLYSVFIMEQWGELMHRSLTLLKRVYCVDVLNMSDEYLHTLSVALETLLEKYTPVLSLRIHLDDNKDYLNLIHKNRISTITGKTDDYVVHHNSGEDIVRLRWFFKTVSYYNKRYLLP